MFEVASQIIICLILAAVLGWIIGYLMGKATCPNDDCSKPQDNSHELHIDNRNTNATESTTLMTEVTGNNQGHNLLLVTEARVEGKDNLQLIKGVGKVLRRVYSIKQVFTILIKFQTSSDRRSCMAR